MQAIEQILEGLGELTIDLVVQASGVGDRRAPLTNPVTAYQTIMGIEGGMMMPNEPAEVTSPRENRSG